MVAPVFRPGPGPIDHAKYSLLSPEAPWRVVLDTGKVVVVRMFVANDDGMTLRAEAELDGAKLEGLTAWVNLARNGVPVGQIRAIREVVRALDRLAYTGRGDWHYVAELCAPGTPTRAELAAR